MTTTSTNEPRQSQLADAIALYLREGWGLRVHHQIGDCQVAVTFPSGAKVYVNVGKFPPNMPVEATAYHDFIEDLCRNIPESYDGDEAAEAIVLRYVRDLEAKQIARCTHHQGNPADTCGAKAPYLVTSNKTEGFEWSCTRHVVSFQTYDWVDRVYRLELSAAAKGGGVVGGGS